MRSDLDPSQLTPDERRHEVAAILAAGLRRLRDRVAITSVSGPAISSEKATNPLEAVGENPLSVHGG